MKYWSEKFRYFMPNFLNWIQWFLFIFHFVQYTYFIFPLILNEVECQYVIHFFAFYYKSLANFEVFLLEHFIKHKIDIYRVVDVSLLERFSGVKIPNLTKYWTILGPPVAINGGYFYLPRKKSFRPNFFN